MKKIIKIALALILAGTLFGNIGYTSVEAYGPTVPPTTTTPGKMYGPYYTWVSGADMTHPVYQYQTLVSAAKKAVIKKYGSVNKNKSYYVSYYNEVVPAGWGYSQKGYIRNVKIIKTK